MGTRENKFQNSEKLCKQENNSKILILKKREVKVSEIRVNNFGAKFLSVLVLLELVVDSFLDMFSWS